MHTKDIFQVVRLVAAALAMLVISPLYGGYEKFIASRTGSGISGGTTLTIQDQWLSYMTANGTSNSLFFVKQANCNAILRFDQSRMDNFVPKWSLEVDYTIKIYDDKVQQVSTKSGTLSIDFDNAAKYEDEDYISFTGMYFKAVLTVDAVRYKVGSTTSTSLPVTFANDIFLDLEQHTERYYNLAASAAPFVYAQQVNDHKELPVSWGFVPGAESYDLEWVFVDIGNTSFSALPPGGYSIDFRNATRINTSNQHYNIPLAYPKGILIYRVRGEGMDAGGSTIKGKWSYNDGSLLGNTQQQPPNLLLAYRLNYNGLEPGYNWQYSATFAEEGKRKEVIQFFDGSLRNQQANTILNTEDSVIIAETKYDFEGRGAVQMMPTPLESRGIRFYSNFNPSFDKQKFDTDATFPSPSPVNSSLDTTGIYYSANANSTGFDGYIPDAQGYPYSRTIYKKDGTNRVSKQSGVGIDHKIGSGHETKYLYGTPFQVELDRLFGVEVGNWLHYKKNVVIDPNGQSSVTYLDQEGRTVATALAGKEPANLLPIDFRTPPDQLTADLLHGKNILIGDAKVSQSTITVTSAGSYKFNYALQPEDYCVDCIPDPNNLPTGFCKDCLYDLEIKITDEDGILLNTTINTSSVPPNTIICTGNPILITAINSATSAFDIPNLLPGVYTVTKTLSLNPGSLSTYYKAAYNFYYNCLPYTHVLPEPCLDCKGICEETFRIALPGGGYKYVDENGVEFTNLSDWRDLVEKCKKLCENPGAKLKTECALKLEMLKVDMSPGGQYFDDRDSLPNNTWLNANIYNPVAHTGPHSNIFTLLRDLIKNDANGCYIPWITNRPNATPPVSNNALPWTSWDSVRVNWKDCFADVLVLYHPEYCLYQFNCDRYACTGPNGEGGVAQVGPIKYSNDYDADMMLDYGTKHYFNPLSLQASSISNDPENYLSTSDAGYIANNQIPDGYFDGYQCPGSDTTIYDSLTIHNSCTTKNYAEKDAMEKMLKHYLVAGTPSVPKYLSIWYVMEDSGVVINSVVKNIHNAANASDASTNVGFFVPNNVYQFFQALHGNGSTTFGILGGPNPVKTKYQYFAENYQSFKKLIQYQRYKTYSFRPPPSGVSCGSYLVSDPAKWTFTPSGYQIRYPKNLVFDTYWDNICLPDFSASASMVTAMQNSMLPSGPGSNPNMLAAYQGNCGQYASQWLAQLKLDCPGKFSDKDTNIIKQNLIDICAHGADPINAVGADHCSGCNVLAKDGTTQLNSFADVRDYYSNGCSSIIVHPSARMINTQVSCSCDKYTKFINSTDCPGCVGNAGLTAATLNAFFSLSGTAAVTSADVSTWVNECTQTNHALAGLSHMPPVLMCAADPTPAYGANECICNNIHDYIASLVGKAPSDQEIADSLNYLLAPNPFLTKYDVKEWRTACSNSSFASTTFRNLPNTFKCYTQEECTGRNFLSFVINMGYAAPTIPQHSYTPTELTNIAASVNSFYKPSVSVKPSQVDTWIDAYTTSTYTSTTFADMPPGLQCDRYAVPPTPTPCELQNLQAAADARFIENMNRDKAAISAATAYINAYKAKCLNTLNSRESFTLKYDLNEYYYTLYYYDQAGNLIKTVPPQGVEVLTSNTNPNLLDVANFRANHAIPMSMPPVAPVPSHKMVTHYWYNSLQQLTMQYTPDGDTTHFYYDYLGRLVISQNSKQEKYAPAPGYSYTLYDELGRIYEVGEIYSSTAMTSIISRDPVKLKNWISPVVGSRSQITSTYYDESYNTAVSAYFGPGGQENVRNRVSTVAFTEKLPANVTQPLQFDRATHYSYDAHGNVKSLIQDNTELKAIGQDLKYIDYEYDLVSSNVKEVRYQARGDLYQNRHFDCFYHRYLYDADNRITHVFTSKDNFIWEQDAKYLYYAYGPTARMEIGDKHVQGVDYVYTIQGWQKGINSTILDNTKDPGHDAQDVTNLHKSFGQDALSYSLRYFADDYKPKNAANGGQFASTNSVLDNDAPGLFNGNISMMSTTLTDIDPNTTIADGTPLPQINAYRYDQLNRIRHAHSYDAINGNAWNPGSFNGRYGEEFHYDLNGNISTVDRKDESGAHLDLLTYNYYKNNASHSTYPATIPSTNLSADISNKLSYVDGDAPTATLADLESQNANNYTYDEIGNLISDDAENLESIEWSVYGKILNIKKPSQEIEYKYDPSGNRVVKILKPRVNQRPDYENTWKYTYYVRDAQGNIMSVYNRSYESLTSTTFKDTFKLDEQNIYGSSRLGLQSGDVGERLIKQFTISGYDAAKEFKNQVYPTPPLVLTVNMIDYIEGKGILGLKQYELTNHLGNVLSVVSDRKNAKPNASLPAKVDFYTADILSIQDYYAFGMLMGGRGYQSDGYRYGFNGKENDDEVKGGEGTQQDYGMRIYDPRLGKFLSCDPLMKEYAWNSPYAFAENDVIRSMDLDGKEKDIKIWVFENEGYTLLKTLSWQDIYKQKQGDWGSGTYNVYYDKTNNQYVGMVYTQKSFSEDFFDGPDSFGEWLDNSGPKSGGQAPTWAKMLANVNPLVGAYNIVSYFGNINSDDSKNIYGEEQNLGTVALDAVGVALPFVNSFGGKAAVEVAETIEPDVILSHLLMTGYESLHHEPTESNNKSDTKCETKTEPKKENKSETKPVSKQNSNTKSKPKYIPM